jgi:hypothetical protein
MRIEVQRIFCRSALLNRLLHLMRQQDSELIHEIGLRPDVKSPMTSRALADQSADSSPARTAA